MSEQRTPLGRLVVAACCIVGLALLLAWSAIFPIGGDPDLMYKPIKSELVSPSLEKGRLPFWSDRFRNRRAAGRGKSCRRVLSAQLVDLPPVQAAHTGYRIAIWLHWLALGGVTFLYARNLAISRAGAILAAVSFTLCGFQAAHIVHEPFNHLMPCCAALPAFGRSVCGSPAGCDGWRRWHWHGAFSSRSGTFRFRCGRPGW